MVEPHSQTSVDSQTAAEFIRDQLSLEAEAREALPYSFDTCTRDLGPLRQGLYACLTCADSHSQTVPAAVCYACSISCHGEHRLVELFNKRNFVCDCGSSRLPATAPCMLRLNPATGQKGGVTGEEPAQLNRYNQNFENKFCGCGEDYDPHQEKGTMFQCLGLGTVDDGGCGEDWWHPECVVGLTRDNFKNTAMANGFITKEISVTQHEEDAGTCAHARRPSITTDIAAAITSANSTTPSNPDGDDNDDTPLPPGFPNEDDFEYFLCYKCVNANPWIKKYAGASGFLPPVYFDAVFNISRSTSTLGSAWGSTNGEPKKRKATSDQDELSTTLMAPPKRQKSEDLASTLTSIPETSTSSVSLTKDALASCKLPTIPRLPQKATKTLFSLFMKPEFRDHLCHCAACFPLLQPYPQLLEEEDIYEPPISEDGEGNGTGSVGTGSLLDRGEAALSNMDRVHAIQGAMAYAHLKDNLKAFLQPFAESGQAVAAEDIKAYFEKLRGDEQGIKEAAGGAAKSRWNVDEDDGDGDGEGDGSTEGPTRKEQSGY